MVTSSPAIIVGINPLIIESPIPPDISKSVINALLKYMPKNSDGRVIINVMFNLPRPILEILNPSARKSKSAKAIPKNDVVSAKKAKN
jgi:hypothetical protein